MNKYDLLLLLEKEKFVNQRTFANRFNVSLGKINSLLKELKQEHLINFDKTLTEKANDLLKQNKPKSAIILAAGTGFRMIPINKAMNKALIDVNGEVLIERLIKQLHEVNITNIYIVVGYMKESFEYLIDKFNVKLIVNNEYVTSNNLHSLYYARKHFSNSYILPCDIYFKENPFNQLELTSWYLVSDLLTTSSYFKISKRQNKLLHSKENEKSNKMLSVAYFNNAFGKHLSNVIEKFYQSKLYTDSFWEELLKNELNNHEVYGKIILESNYMEFNECKDLQAFDYNSKCLNLEIFDIITSSLNIQKCDILNITALKTGMTNNSFLFETNDKKYIMRIPGEGTEKLINRKQEKQVYDVINPLNISDPIIYFDPYNGYKLTEYIPNTHNCDPLNKSEVELCMRFLKKFHDSKLKVNHEFDIFEKIEYYESLWKTQPSKYPDYQQTKNNIYILKNFINSLDKNYTLTHIDAVPDNFLLFKNNNKREIRLIDWEYAAMQDPHVDIAMFAIYAMYDRQDVDQLIDFYFENNCNKQTRLKIYAYIACCGLLWSNWCEYKFLLGIEFGEYSLAQYRFAKEYFNIIKNELGEKIYEYQC